jgi:hypothetical protein
VGCGFSLWRLLEAGAEKQPLWAMALDYLNRRPPGRLGFFKNKLDDQTHNFAMACTTLLIPLPYALHSANMPYRI